MKQQKYIWLFIMVMVLLVGLGLSIYNTNVRIFEKQVKNASHQLQNFEKNFNALTANNEALSNLLESESQDISEQALNFELFVYHNQQLIKWTSNLTTPENKLTEIAADGSLIRLKNGFYYAFKHQHKDYHIVGLQLIKNEYSIENRYLQNSFSSKYFFDKSVQIALNDELPGTPVVGQNGKVYFSVVSDNSNRPTASIWSIWFSVFTWLMAALLLLIACIKIYQKLGFTLSLTAFLVSGFALTFSLQIIPFEFLKTNLFSPELYASNRWGESLGHLFINTLIGTVIILFIFITVRSKKYFEHKYAIYLIGLLSLLTVAYFTLAIKSLILDSTISFEINNFTILNRYTFVGLAIIVFLNIIFFLVQILIVKSALKRKSPFVYLLILAIVSGLIVTYILQNINWGILISLLLLIFYAIQSKWGIQEKELSFYGSFIILLFFSSFLTAAVLEFFNVEKNFNKNLVAAQQLSKQRDLIAEYKYEEIHSDMLSDAFIKKYFTSPLVTKKDLRLRLNYLYFDGYLSKYNVELFAFNQENYLIKSSKTDTLKQFISRIENNTQNTFSPSLYFKPDEDGNYRYYSILKILDDGNFVGTMVIELTPKTYQKENLYPELLIEEKNRPIIDEEHRFDYAIYVNSKLASQSGEYPYSFILDYRIPAEAEYATFQDFGFNHLVYSDTPGRTIVVSNVDESLLMPVSIFSYLFCFFLIVGIVVMLVFSGIAKYLLQRDEWSMFNISFRNRVNFAMILIIVSSFIIIGFITVRYFSNEYDNYHEQRLIRKQKSVLSALEYTIKENYSSGNNESAQGIFQSGLSNEIAALSEIHSMDINVFDLSGNLMVSSQPGIFSNGLISSKINPKAYYTLKTQKIERLVQEEQIGSLNYLAIYIPIRNAMGEAIGYLNLPYFAKEENMRTEISEFMVALVNVYVFLLLVAGIIAFLVSNSITSPLADISNKLRLVNLSKKNEMIQWDTNDEIGALVKEYNKMIRQLEQSAKLLARSERESAWREMARQIAHEIKNPLTPMKLSIQHLQRAIVNDPERATELAQRVSNTLIEQIENLAEIATAFSSFAKMPKANNELVDLKGILQNVVDLFREKPEVQLSFETELKEGIIYADKNQMLSVFNNLIKNAIQATEEVDNPKVAVKLLLENDHLKVEITDNGVGIEEEMKEKVFVPNFTTKSSGTGLGLAISKQIVEQSASGAIWFDSEANKGTTFYVVLPKYKTTV